MPVLAELSGGGWVGCWAVPGHMSSLPPKHPPEHPRSCDRHIYIYCSTATFCTGHILYMHFWFSQSHFFLRASGAQTQRSKPCGPRRCGRRTWSQIIFLTLGEPADDSACRICQEYGVPCCPACESAPRAPVQHKWRLIEHVLFDYYARVYQALACLWRLLFSG